ncbi:T9SS type A sorting domain-containing protein [Sphingobacterium hungaricum]|uniref:Secretion system C-terminal sorting domain-containing protein n=1 Tax=Sphingobacterium hungaricum TaxID=2082723 RepID=A0A928UVL3_9SPHI|nr:T9SS type A sorting domain-containing protein [Sphingobacterium hungaricum]MBE8712728.1 hypothetical protein [Sphingobacterium hungaricum]
MKRNYRIVHYVILTIMLAMSGKGMLYASNFSALSTSKTTVNIINEEEEEKAVSNVKVFFNPIAQQISVSLKVNKQNNTTIKVMDALGNEVLSLMNGTLEVGNQNLNFETNDKLTAGFYFVRVSVGTETVVKRISVR